MPNNDIFFVKKILTKVQLENDAIEVPLGIFTSLDLFIRDDEEKKKLLSELESKNEIVHTINNDKYLIIKRSRRTEK